MYNQNKNHSQSKYCLQEYVICRIKNRKIYKFVWFSSIKGTKSAYLISWRSRSPSLFFVIVLIRIYCWSRPSLRPRLFSWDLTHQIQFFKTFADWGHWLCQSVSKPFFWTQRFMLALCFVTSLLLFTSALTIEAVLEVICCIIGNLFDSSGGCSKVIY